jgi:hypothetical protein
MILEAIKWDGTNLKEVITFTGKHLKWDTWFKSWEEYEAHVKNDGNLFKIIYADGTSALAAVGDYIIRDGGKNVVVKDRKWVEPRKADTPVFDRLLASLPSDPVRYALVEKAYVVDTEEAAQKLMRKELPSGMRPDYTIVKVIP